MESHVETAVGFNSQLIQYTEILANTESDSVALLANWAAYVYHSYSQLNWVGFYRYSRGELVLGPFQGTLACSRIKPNKGVCGTAWLQQRTHLVPNVHHFPGHIACDSASQSELVVPLMAKGCCWGVIDLDSPILNRFTPSDAFIVERCAALLEKSLSKGEY